MHIQAERKGATMRKSVITRKTAETDITLAINIDGTGKSNIETGCGFLNHMLTLFAKHSGFDLDVKCVGDVDVDFHHTAEDIGIVLGNAFAEALGDKKGIKRYGSFLLPMDESLVMIALDISGRSMLCFDCDMPTAKVGSFDTELCEEFMQAFARSMNITLHIKKFAGSNSHHIIEAVFKGLAHALKEAVEIDEKLKGQVLSTKGVI